MKKINLVTIGLLLTPALLLGACSQSTDTLESKAQGAAANDAAQVEVIEPHKELNQQPVPVKIERDGKDVYIEMTAQITDIEIDEDTIYKAWTFNGEAPGPLLKVKQGDTIHFTLANHDPAIPHSMDFHAVHTAPSVGFADVAPNEEGTFVYEANKPGVFMYHCGTDPVISHIANGMHGMIIVEPDDGYPTDQEVDVEYVVIQNEWYKYNDFDDMINGVPSQMVFSTKALHEGQANTNGKVFGLKAEPLHAKVGDKVRFYVLNVGPNEVSSFHIVGTIMDDVYIDGNPYNHMKGLQTIMLPASGGAVVEFTVKEAGNYPFVTHQFNHATKGAVGIIEVTE
ncbi:multicopper oxidase domain-containing protein [Bacillaceae bacterium W0354]